MERGRIDNKNNKSYANVQLQIEKLFACKFGVRNSDNSFFGLYYIEANNMDSGCMIELKEWYLFSIL